MVKAKLFKRVNLKGICGCGTHAAGYVIYPDGSEIRCCVDCAKSLVKHGKIRKGRHKCLGNGESLIYSGIPRVINRNKGILRGDQ